MEVRLPKRRDGNAPEALTIGPGDSCVIIGANGAGKTRFTSEVVRLLGEKAFRISALDGIYNRRRLTQTSATSLMSMLDPAILATAEKGAIAPTTLEMLLSQLMHEEMLNLIGYKLALTTNPKAVLNRTRLDKVVDLWQGVFPGNKVLIDSGKILFSRGLDPEGYSSIKLSDGEKAVLFYAIAVSYAPKGSVIFVDSPEIFLHPTMVASLWNRLEFQRPDCSFCYTTHDPEFASSRNGAPVVWVRDCDTAHLAWDYDTLPSQDGMPPELYMSLVGARKPVLFIEGDSRRSIDARLYPLIFPDYTVRSLGSCNKVIEATRTFNGLSSFHNLDSFGIVDRDRRDDGEVGYLRSKNIMVPEVAEVENLFLLENVVKTMATMNRKDPERVFAKVKSAIISLFRGELRQQALMHTRHYMKKMVERRVDARFSDITTLEKHVAGLVDELDPRSTYERLCRDFHNFVDSGDYASVLKVFNQKSMLGNCNVAPLCGYNNKDSYINAVISTLRTKTKEAESIRNALRRGLGL